MPPMSSSSGWVHFLIRQGWPQTRRASLRVFDRRCYSSGQSRPSYHHPQQQQQPSELEVKPLFHYTEVRLASYLSGLFFSFMTVMGLNELMSGRALEAKSADEMYHDHQDFAGSSHLEKNKKVETTTTVQGQGELRFRMFASVDVERELMMTPRDVLESLVQDRPRPRIKSRVSEVIVTAMSN